MPYTEQTFFDARTKPSDDDIRKKLARSNSSCPLSSFIGNEEAVRRLTAIAFCASRNANHAVIDTSTGSTEKANIAFIGPPGFGKTTLAKKFMQSIDLPFIELGLVKDTQQIFDAISNEMKKIGTPLSNNNGVFRSPPCGVFMDEVHKYVSKGRKSATGIAAELLKGTEPNDAVLTKQGEWTLDCKQICWLFATTDWYDLPKALRDRFEVIELQPYSRDEVIRILVARFPKVPIGPIACAAKYGKNVPRLSIAFVNAFSREKNFANSTWEQAVARMVVDRGIDAVGIDRATREVIGVLNEEVGIGVERLTCLSGRSYIELMDEILPGLMGQGWIKLTPKGVSLLPSGMAYKKEFCEVHKNAA